MFDAIAEAGGSMVIDPPVGVVVGEPDESGYYWVLINGLVEIAEKVFGVWYFIGDDNFYYEFELEDSFKVIRPVNDKEPEL